MKRPWHVWLAFALCGVVATAAFAWLTLHALRVDRERSLARAEAQLEQNVSQALWQMDTKLAPLIAEEVTRPHEFYESFVNVPAANKSEWNLGSVASPILAKTPDNVLLNFNAYADGRWASPQAPPPEQTELAASNGLPNAATEANRRKLETLADAVNVGQLLEILPDDPIPTPNLVTGGTPQSTGGDQVAANGPPIGNYYSANAPAGGEGDRQMQTAEQPLAGIGDDEANPFDEPDISLQQQVAQQSRGAADYRGRESRYQQAAVQELSKQQFGNSLMRSVPSQRDANDARTVEYVSRPVWVGDELLLARRVDRDGQTFVQGSWLDWPRLKRELLAETASLVPHADLVPVRGDDPIDATRMLAGLPVKLVVGDSTAALASATGDGPLQWALGVGWVALACALAAVGLLLWGVVALSERRAAFVSSVTHELRTPLTTFRMYAEMLARDMVPTPERRREYLQTLRTEAERLTHLVENVLSYARLERGRKPQRSERTTPAVLVDRFEPRLAERAAQAGMTLQCDVDEASADAPLLTDVGVVEQILFNLVDNAAKYAGRATDRRIVFSTVRDGRWASFSVRDFGPGFVSTKQALRSTPFSKSAQEAAESAPGVGLGLALCRRLARELGGELSIGAANGGPGASVQLRLPAG
ncbi:sensor histidine kinase [Lacipirellula sp.]|uniref:sensor histidine kinase n=1 Tax=Lacipirellula sp. TaxID=2691419 RepID=UPI003D13E1F0